MMDELDRAALTVSTRGSNSPLQAPPLLVLVLPGAAAVGTVDCCGFVEDDGLLPETGEASSR